MTLDRHLLPQEFDLLLDEETGFGIPPLRTHVAGCPQCTAELNATRKILRELEGAPHFAPSALFEEKVMARVQVYPPWHVAAADAARRLVPSPGPLRTLAMAACAIAATTMTGLTLWFATRAGSFLLLLELGARYARRILADTAGDLLGASATGALTSAGSKGMLLVLSAVVVAGAIAAVGIARAARLARVRGEA